MTTLTPSQVATAGAILLSLIVSYVPGVHAWYAKLDKLQKRLVMLGSVLVIVVITLGLSCAGIVNFAVCDDTSLNGLLRALFDSLVANQVAFLLSPQKSKVIDALVKPINNKR